MNKIKVLIADDHQIVRKGLKSLLEEQPDMIIAGEAEDGLELLDLADRRRPDVALVDITMPNFNGIDAAEALKSRCPNLRVVILSMHAEPFYIEQAQKVGTYGYVLKGEDMSEVCNAIRAAFQGKTYMNQKILELLPDSADLDHLRANPLDALTVREHEIFQMVAEGKTSQQIAKRLDISRRTVEVHRAHIMKKLNMVNTTDLIKLALKYGIIKGG